MHCCWDCKLAQLLWKTVWRFLKKLKIELPYDPTVPSWENHNSKWYMHHDVPCNTIYNDQYITAAVTKYCGCGRPGGFQRQTFFSCGSGSWGSKIQVPADSGSRFIGGAFSLGLLHGGRHTSSINSQHVHVWLLTSSSSHEVYSCYFGSLPRFVVVVQLLSHVHLFATPWTAAHQASLSFTISRSLLKLMSIESVKSSNHLILYHPSLFLPSIFPSIRVFSNQLALCIRWS